MGALCIGEVCCCAGTCKSATCCDGDGCVAATVKCCCSLFHGEIPPSNTPGCGCGPLMCGGNLDPSRRDALSPREQEEFDMLSTTCWCLFLYCVGFGCNSPAALTRAAWWRASFAAVGRNWRQTPAVMMAGSSQHPSAVASSLMALILLEGHQAA